MSDRYELYYWPFIPGRGEFPRLMLEATDTPYDDVARRPEEEGGGVPALQRFLGGQVTGLRPYAPPFLVAAGHTIAQTVNICAWLAPRLGLVPDDEGARLAARQHALTLADLVDEAHDVHHPITSGMYYEEQKQAAKAAAGAFLDQRLPKFLGYFEAVLQDNGGEWLVGDALSYPDLSLFHTLEGLAYAFPNGFARVSGDTPGLLGLRDRVRALPKVAAYLDSDRRLAFNQHGIFRHYPELDPLAG